MISYESRIEFQLLQTQQSLQEANIKYNRWSYIPSLSAFANYNLAYQNDVFSDLYSKSFPNSFAGLRVSLPIFQGTKRTQQVRQAELELRRVEYDIIALKNAINSQYMQALAAYKSNLNDYVVLKGNLEIAQEVYNTIQLQYKAGVKTFLEVIIAETDLRTSQVNYVNALYQVLSSKLDVQRALGTIEY
jgi:outer membrane protein TolC